MWSKSSERNDLLVVEADVRPPDVIGRNVEHAHLTVLGWLPHEFVVVPILLREDKSDIFFFFKRHVVEIDQEAL